MREQRLLERGARRGGRGAIVNLAGVVGLVAVAVRVDEERPVLRFR